MAKKLDFRPVFLFYHAIQSGLVCFLARTEKSQGASMKASDGAADKFYTRHAVARRAVNLIPDLDTYPLIVEPSAGAGAFLDALPQAVGLDIEPDDDRIMRTDWLTHEMDGHGGLLVGNPPFGRRSSLAKAFIRRGDVLGFETIAFILPDTFRKMTAQSVFGADWRLIVEEALDDDTFEHPDGPVRIPCVFQVWTKRPGALNLRKRKAEQPAAYTFLGRADASADICLNGNSGKVRSPNEITNEKAEHYIRLNGDKAAVLERLRTLPLRFSSSVSGGVAWVSKNEINEAWWRQGKLNPLLVRISTSS